MERILNRKIRFSFVLFFMAFAVSAEPVEITKYCPENAKLDGTEDLFQYIQKAVNENKEVILTGSEDSRKPYIYGIRIPEDGMGLKIPSGHTLSGEKNAIIKRLPSSGKLIIAEKASRIKNITIDGNKTSHWPQFQDLGKNDNGIMLMGNCVVQDCFVFNNPGSAFSTNFDNNLIQHCKAVNSGYIDVKFNKKFYHGKWDKWSGDSFYIRGHNNVVMDCESEDAFRWDYTTCHQNAGNSLFVNCKGRDSKWETYGFIDIEGCDGNGSTMINCISPDGQIGISTSNSKLIDSVSNAIRVFNADNVIIANCKTLGGGLVVGGWSSLRNAQIKGGACPVIINNVITKSSADAGFAANTSDWSFSVFSEDGNGLVADNILNEYKDSSNCGSGLKFDKVTAYGNTLQYCGGNQETGKGADTLNGDIRARLMEFSRKIPETMKSLNVESKIVAVTFSERDIFFANDQEGKGYNEKWYLKTARPENILRISQGQDDNANGVSWYFSSLYLDMDLQHNCKKVYLLFEDASAECKVYANGELVGQNSKCGSPFIIEVPSAKFVWQNKDKANDITVAVNGGSLRGFIAVVMTE